MPLRQHPSHQAMRHPDGLRQQGVASREPPSMTGQTGLTNGAYQKIFPPVGAHDYQEFPSRRPTTANATAAPRARYDVSSPLPDRPPAPVQASDSASSQNGGGSHTAHTHGHAKAPSLSRSISPDSRRSSSGTYETQATSFELPALQAQSNLEDSDPMEPLTGDLAGSFDLVAPPEETHHQSYSLERRSEQLFSRAHLEIIFSTPSTLLRFTAFLSTHRPQSVPILIYYLDALKALKAIKYANAIAEALSPISGYDFTANLAQPTTNNELEEKAASAFAALTQEDLPAFITQMYVQIVSLSISRRITGTLAPHLREASEGLAEVFCLTDPSRPDNPIVFASEGKIPSNYSVWDELCHREELPFLARPKDTPSRRDGSPFMNMLMIAPLCDSRGKIRYFIGAQVDVSGLIKDCTDLESLQQLVAREQKGVNEHDGFASDGQEVKDDFQDLSEMLNMAELETVRKYGGRMHREYQEEEGDVSRSGAPHMPRLLLQEPTADDTPTFDHSTRQSGRLSGIYQNVRLQLITNRFH
ncbi:hypothetical protein ACLMJK_006669 [Lecanora helva]